MELPSLRQAKKVTAAELEAFGQLAPVLLVTGSFRWRLERRRVPWKGYMKLVW